MKKAMHAEIIVAIALMAAVIVIFAIFQGQQQKGIGTKIDKLKETIFPDKMKSVVIPGTTVSATEQKVFNKRLNGTKEENLKKLIGIMEECIFLASKNNYDTTVCGTIDISGMIDEINEVEIKEKLTNMNKKIDFKIGDSSYSLYGYDSLIKNPIIANCTNGVILVQYMSDKNVYLSSSETNCPIIEINNSNYLDQLKKALNNCYSLGTELERTIDCYQISTNKLTKNVNYGLKDIIILENKAQDHFILDEKLNMINDSSGILKVCYYTSVSDDDLTLTTKYGDCEQSD